MNRPLSNYFSALLISALVSIGAVLPNQVFAAWSVPVSLQAFTLLGLPAGKASVAVNTDGNGVAVWIDEGTGKVMYALQKTGFWKPAKVLYTPALAKNETTDGAQVVMQADGTAVAIFSSTTPGALKYCVSGLRVVRCYGPNKSFAKAAILAPGATTWTKQNISNEGVLVQDTQIGLDQYGNVTASWTYFEKAGVQLALQVATKAPTLAWSAPVTVYRADGLLTKPSLSVGSSGHAVLAWQESFATVAGVGYKIYAVFADNALAGAWTGVDEVAVLANPASAVRSAVDGLGKAVLVWDENYSIATATRLCMATCLWNGQLLFSAPVDLTTMAFAPDIAADNQGDFLFAWSKVTVTGNSVEAQLQQADGTVVTASWIGNAGPVVSMAADGSLATVAWVDINDYSAYVAKFFPTPNLPTKWARQAKHRLGSALWGSQIAVGTAAAGRASAVWQDNNGREFFYKYVGSVLR